MVPKLSLKYKTVNDGENLPSILLKCFNTKDAEKKKLSKFDAI
jgi:hypothetical protein